MKEKSTFIKLVGSKTKKTLHGVWVKNLSVIQSFYEQQRLQYNVNRTTSIRGTQTVISISKWLNSYTQLIRGDSLFIA